MMEHQRHFLSVYIYLYIKKDKSLILPQFIMNIFNPMILNNSEKLFSLKIYEQIAIS